MRAACWCTTRFTTGSEKFLAAIESAKVGDPLDPTTFFGPVISQVAADRILGVTDGAIAYNRPNYCSAASGSGAIWLVDLH